MPNAPSNPKIAGELDVVTTVDIGTINITDQNASYNIDKAFSPDVWADYMVKNQFEQDRHIYMMGMTSLDGFAGDTVAFVQLASPTLLWICRWTACRANIHPDIPSPDPADTNWIFMDQHIEPVMIQLGRDGVTPVYRISGVYVYGHRKPTLDISPYLVHARPPWIQDVVDRSVPRGTFQQNIMNRAGAKKGGGGLDFPVK